MTTEAKAYDEALERARKILNKILDNKLLGFPDQIRKIFPELRESDEDEKVRKELIEQVGYIVPDKEECDNEGRVLPTYHKRIERYRAYLEKQKDTIQAKVKQRMEYLWDKLPDAHRVEEGNCTPEEWKALGAYMELEMNFDESSEEKQKEQKPAEWSDADNIGWDEAFACVIRAEKVAKNEEELQNAVTAENWLKEIKFKYYVHPVKQEWGEEDERNFYWISTTIQERHLTPEYTQQVHKILSWLKSLRPQPHWKPSEEQMEALKDAVKLYKDTHFENFHQRIESLYEQLKKLM